MNLLTLSTQNCLKRKKGVRKIKFMAKTISRTSPRKISRLKRTIPKGTPKIESRKMYMNKILVPGIPLLTHRTVSMPPTNSLIKILRIVNSKEAV